MRAWHGTPSGVTLSSSDSLVIAILVNLSICIFRGPVGTPERRRSGRHTMTLPSRVAFGWRGGEQWSDGVHEACAPTLEMRMRVMPRSSQDLREELHTVWPSRSRSASGNWCSRSRVEHFHRAPNKKLTSSFKRFNVWSVLISCDTDCSSCFQAVSMQAIRIHCLVVSRVLFLFFLKLIQERNTKPHWERWQSKEEQSSSNFGYKLPLPFSNDCELAEQSESTWAKHCLNWYSLAQLPEISSNWDVVSKTQRFIN